MKLVLKNLVPGKAADLTAEAAVEAVALVAAVAEEIVGRQLAKNPPIRGIF